MVHGRLSVTLCAHSSLRIENSTVSRTWPVQVMRSARMTPSRTAPSFFIAAWLRSLRLVDAELDAAEAAVEGAAQHHVLDPPVEAGAAQVRAVIGAADLQHCRGLVDAEEARHAGELVAVEQDEGAVALAAAVEVDALVEAVGAEIDWRRSARCRGPRRRRRAARRGAARRTARRGSRRRSSARRGRRSFLVEVLRDLGRAQQLVDVAALVEAFVGEELELGGIFGPHPAARPRAGGRRCGCAAPSAPLPRPGRAAASRTPSRGAGRATCALR